MNVDYLTGEEAPTAELMDDLFAALDGKLTTLLGGRSFFLAQTATLPQYLIGKTFFFTAGGAVYAPRVPGYIETNTSTKPVARPYNHAQFTAAQAAMVFQPGYLKSATIQQPGTSYLLNDTVTLAGGTVAPGGQPAQLQVTQRDTLGQIVAFNLINPGSYSVLPPTPNQVNGGHGNGAWLDCNLVQFDLYNKVAPINKLGSTYYQGLPVAADVGLFEWSLAAHSVMYQGRGDKKPVRYYLQDGGSATMPEKHYKFALAEIIIEGVTTVTIPKAWDKYACFRIHNLNPQPAKVVFEGYTVSLTPFQCATVRRDWVPDTATVPGHHQNYRPGYNYFFKFEGGDPRFYWFFPTSNAAIGYGGKAANSMQANNLVNPAILQDWMLALLRKPDGSTTFAGWNEDASEQADIYPQLQKYFGDPSNPATLVGDLIHHPGEVVILRRPKKLYQVQHVIVDNGGDGYVVNDQIAIVGGVPVIYSNPAAGLIYSLNAVLKVTAVDANGGIVAASILTMTAIVSVTGGAYIQPPPAYCGVSGGTGSGAIFSVICGWVTNTFTQIFGTQDAVKFRGYKTLVADLAAKLLTVAENSSGNLVITNADPANDVFLFPVSTNLLKTGETLPAMVDLSGTSAFTIESAIFESEPEQAHLDTYTLSVSPPQIIQQPVATTATPTKTWTDIFTPVTDTYGRNPGAAGYQWTSQIDTQAGAPQTTLNWNTSRSLQLYSAAIADGGGGYVVGDTLNPNGGTLGGANIAAEIQVTAVTGGKITGIQIVQRGGYASAPASANTVSGGSGTGAILNLVFLNSYNAIHKRTVADLLTLDWWGDPQYPGQNSPWVVIENRALQFTPGGLVLTFTETDSPLPGDVLGQPASLPTWASGQRGQPRNRQIRFRLHGWGYCGVAYGGGNAIPPSGKSAIWSPTQGRQSASGAYRGEVVAPNGADFFVKGWSFSKPSAIQMLTRIEPANLTSDGRFWKLPGDATWQFVFPANLYFESVSLLLGGNLSTTSSVYFYSAATFVNAPPPVMALGLVVEMYNGLARAVNSLTSGTPLMWQCLLFNVGGYVTGLDPKHSIGGIPRYPDNVLVGFQAGLPLPLFNSSGQLVSQPSGNGYMNYAGPRPMNQFCAFDQGSLYQRLCGQLGIPVKTENDLPGGTDVNGDPAALNYFQQKISAPAVYVDTITATANISVSPDYPSGVLIVFPTNGWTVAQIASINVTVTADVTNTLDTDLLSTAAILKGQATGKHCLGTYDPTKFNSGLGVVLPGNPPIVPYPDFTNAPAGGYYIANDGSAQVAYYGPVYSGGFVGFGGIQQSLFTVPAPGLAYCSAYQPWASYVSAPYPIDLVNGFTGYRWVGIEDIQKVVTALGFPFLWVETCTPLELKYFEDPTTLAVVAGQASVTAEYTAQFAGAINRYTFLDGSTWDNVQPRPGKSLATVGISNFSNSGLPGHGTLIKFCTSTSKSAAWKIAPIGVTTPAGLAVAGTVPVEVVNVRSRASLSPLFRYVTLGAAPSLNGNDTTSYGPTVPFPGPTWPAYGAMAGGGSQNWWAFWQSPGTYFYDGWYQTLILNKPYPPTVRPSVGSNFPQLEVQYLPKGGDRDFSDLLAVNYSEGTLLDQKQVLGFNIYSSYPIAALPVLLSAQPAWEKQKDAWGALDPAYAAVGYYGGYNSQYVPWAFVNPAESFTQYVTDYFDGAGQNGLTIIEAKADQRFWCCFATALFDLNLVTFNSQDYQ